MAFHSVIPPVLRWVALPASIRNPWPKDQSFQRRNKEQETYRFEGRDFRAIVCPRVVDGHATRFAGEVAVWNLVDALAGSVTSFEVHVCGPVIGKIFLEATCCAICSLRHVRIRNSSSERILQIHELRLGSRLCEEF